MPSTTAKIRPRLRPLAAALAFFRTDMSASSARTPDIGAFEFDAPDHIFVGRFDP